MRLGYPACAEVPRPEYSFPNGDRQAAGGQHVYLNSFVIRRRALQSDLFRHPRTSRNRPGQGPNLSKTTVALSTIYVLLPSRSNPPKTGSETDLPRFRDVRTEHANHRTEHGRVASLRYPSRRKYMKKIPPPHKFSRYFFSFYRKVCQRQAAPDPIANKSEKARRRVSPGTEIFIKSQKRSVSAAGIEHTDRSTCNCAAPRGRAGRLRMFARRTSRSSGARFPAGCRARTPDAHTVPKSIP